MKFLNRAPTVNSLLAALPESEYEALLAHLEPVLLAPGEILCESGEPIQQIYFPNDCLISLMAVEEEGMALEVWLVGNEGVVGLPVSHEPGLSPVRALVQSEGSAMRMSAARLRHEVKENFPLLRLLSDYVNSLMLQANQIAVCSHFHMLEARLARSLLMTRDHLQSNEFHLTHEFLAHTLGVRRVGVTKAASALQQLKLISYSRGAIKILDGKGLEAASCGCYQAVKRISRDHCKRLKPPES